MTTRRKVLIALAWAAALRSVAGHAQQGAKAPRVGVLFPGPQAALASRIEALKDGLRSAGYPQPERIELILRAAEGDPSRIAPLAAEVLKSNVDVVLAAAAPAVQALRSSTKTIPIVALDLETDPVASGLAVSLARPGGNVTGMYFDFPDFTAKWLQLLREIMPKISRVAVLWDPATGKTQVQAVEGAARTLGIKLQVLEVREPPAVDNAFASARKQGAEGVVMLSSPLFGAGTQQTAQLALRHKLPAITLFPAFARDGGLLAYGPNLLAVWRQAGTMVGKVLKGAKPAELPIERPSKY